MLCWLRESSSFLALALFDIHIIPAVFLIYSRLLENWLLVTMESSGNFDRFSIDEDDDDLEDDFSSGSMSFNGRLVISGDPVMCPSLGSPGKINSINS